jgi:DUF4097 and DUF4098 domain-containing protein YvlB
VIERVFAVDGSALVKIAIRSGWVVVEGGEPGTLRFAVDTRDPTFDIRQRGDAIVASGERGGRAQVTVSVPSSTRVEISTGSGTVTVGPQLAGLDVSSSSGDLSFGDVVRLQVKTASGDVRGNRVEGEAQCVTASGDIRIAEVSDRADLSTASGNVVIERCSGNLTCATVSGDVEIKEMSGPSLNIKAMSGAVRIGIPAGTRLDLDASSLSGRIRLPSPNPSPEPPEREMTARIRLISGDLRIDRIS